MRWSAALPATRAVAVVLWQVLAAPGPLMLRPMPIAPRVVVLRVTVSVGLCCLWMALFPSRLRRGRAGGGRRWRRRRCTALSTVTVSQATPMPTCSCLRWKWWWRVMLPLPLLLM